ncbi:hypothetical protein [Xylophilus ampelinus]|uniref:Uncharacterized protein n=1 Tax=Xylophilus ampelinus TaxID=54067 RepID=A0A318SCQ1_9BURK|nr:hypothetical protein [Xylophilus ampelinus]MCS4511506.1 hypothetical protein [Xylophilus ampelinus]PYE74372.1 hypothetical protein DFQ15_12545 [Xylophilus ampelinus]
MGQQHSTQYESPKVLAGAIENMDALSQEAFAQIEALSNASLKRLEDPSVVEDVETLARMLNCIRDTAARAMNDINSEAERYGANSIDRAETLRAAAVREARDKRSRIDGLLGRSARVSGEIQTSEPVGAPAPNLADAPCQPGTCATPAPRRRKDLEFVTTEYENWTMGGPVPLVLNPAADVHTLIAWCWGQSHELQEWTEMLLTLAPESGVTASQLAGVIWGRLRPLTNMLHALGDRTSP